MDRSKIREDQARKGVREQDTVYSRPKARWVAGGHRDPDIGEGAAQQPRTDAPTADLLGQHLVCVLAAANGWQLQSSDVSNAFLRWTKVDRNFYVRMPRPLPPGTLAEPGQLAKLEKGMYGLTEAPRLWYLEYEARLV